MLVGVSKAPVKLKLLVEASLIADSTACGSLMNGLNIGVCILLVISEQLINFTFR